MSHTTLKALHFLHLMLARTPISLPCLYLPLPHCWQFAPQARGTVTFFSWRKQSSLLPVSFPLTITFGAPFLGCLGYGSASYEAHASVSVRELSVFFQLLQSSHIHLQHLLALPLHILSPAVSRGQGTQGRLHPQWINTWLNLTEWIKPLSFWIRGVK